MRALIGGYAMAPPTEPRSFSREELLKLTGITPSQLNYYVREGAVSKPIGRTRAARYSMGHVEQIRRVIDQLTIPGWTVGKIAEAAARTKTGRKAWSAPKSPGTVVTENAYSVSENVRIVVRQEPLAIEKDLVNRMIKAAEMTMKERRRYDSESLERYRSSRQPQAGRS